MAASETPPAESGAEGRAGRGRGECSVAGCDRPALARSFCSKHYERNRKYGSPHALRQYATPGESFLARTEPLLWSGCLIWTGALARGGYGQITVGSKQVPAHRYAWERENGPIPEGMKVDHRYHCNPACCEVSHLRLATTAENGWNRNGASRNSTTGIRHVNLSRGKPRVQIRRGGRYHCSTHETLEEAAAVAERITREWDGEFAGPVRARGD